MIEFKYKKPRVNNGDLRTQVTFYEYRPNPGPYPDQYEYGELYKCWAKVEQVWLKDLETAKMNNTVSDVTLTIRDPQGTYYPTNKHYLKISAPEYDGYVYNVTTTQPDLQVRGFYTVVATLKGDMSWE